MLLKVPDQKLEIYSPQIESRQLLWHQHSPILFQNQQYLVRTMECWKLGLFHIYLVIQQCTFKSKNSHKLKIAWLHFIKNVTKHPFIKVNYLNTPPKATSSPKIQAVGSLSNAMSIALVIACNSVIFVVSPRNEYSYSLIDTQRLTLNYIKNRNWYRQLLYFSVLPLLVSVGSGLNVKWAFLLLRLFAETDAICGIESKRALWLTIFCPLSCWLAAKAFFHMDRVEDMSKYSFHEQFLKLWKFKWK